MIKLLIADYNPMILCLQETNFKNTQAHKLKNFSCFFRNRENGNRASGGVAVYVSNSIEAESIPLVTQLEAVAVSIKDNIKFSICNLYIPPNRETSPEEITNLLNQIPSPRMIVGDFNAHNYLWGSKKQTPLGHKIETILEQLNLNLLNDGQNTRFDSKTGESSAIDLSLCDPPLSPLLTWDVLPHLFDSDHFPIIIINEPKSNPNPIERWKLKNANWSQFQELVENNLCDLEPNLDIDHEINIFTQVISQSATKCIGTTNQNNKRLPVPWWNPECAEAIKLSHQAFNRFKKQKTENNSIEFKRLRAKARYIVKQSKRQAWADFVSTIDSSTPLTTVWKKVKKVSGSTPYNSIYFLEQNDNIYHSKQEMSDILASTYQEYSSTDNYTAEFQNKKLTQEQNPIPLEDLNNLALNTPISLEEFLNVLQNYKNSSPGPDNIPIIFLQNLTLKSKEHLLKIYNFILRNNVFPTAWTNSTIVPILKQGKTKSDPESYRPISLTCSMCKVLEKIINNRLMWYLESSKIIIPEQSGFRKHRSTVDNLVDLESEIHEAFAIKQHCIAVFFDIHRAYDTVWRYSIVKTLSDWSIRGNILKFIANFLHYRQFRVRVDGAYSQPRTQENGIPQGSNLSTTLFLVAINSITEKCKNPVKARLYADDLVIFCRGKNLDTIHDHIQATVTQIEEWSCTSGLRFNPTKTKALIFTKHNQTQPKHLYIYGKQIKYVNEFKFLGMIFDHKLSWKTHIQHLKKSCQPGLNLLRTLAYKTWGADYPILLRLYKALIRSKLDYGAIVYNSAKKHLLKTLDPVQNSALRISLGAYHTSPVQSLHCECGELPLDLRRIYLSLSYIAIVSSNHDNPVRHNVFSDRFKTIFDEKVRTDPPFYQRIRNYLANLEITLPSTYDIPSVQTFPPWTLPIPTCDTSLTTLNKSETPADLINQEYRRLLSESSFFQPVYTDASKNAHGVGAAVYSETFSASYKLLPATTIFSAELFAILRATVLIQEDNLQYSIIITDSLSSINALSQTYSTHPLVLRIKNELASISNRNSHVRFLWIPSHTGIAGNERVDKLAKEAVTSRESAEIDTMVHTDLKPHFKDKVLNTWQQIWNNDSSKLSEIKSTVKPWKFVPRRRSEQVALTRLRLGHTRLTHEYLISKNPRPTCEVCNSDMTVKHILIECNKYLTEKRKYQIPNTIKSILGEECSVQNVIKFLKDIKILNRI